MKYLSALSSRRHMKGHARAHGGDLHIGAEDKLRICDKHFTIEIFAVTLETWVFLDLEYDEDVAASAAARPDISGTAHRHVLSSRDTSGNLDGDFLLLSHASLAAAFPAGRRNDGSFACARRTWSDADHLAKERAL